MTTSDDWEDDEDFDSEFEADGNDPDRDDPDADEPTIRCPYCQQEIHEDAQRCPHCENYISREDAPASAKPWWIVLGVGLAGYAVYRWVVG